MKTEILVLAAGRGSRLGHRVSNAPKWLLPVGDRTIADRQLEAIEVAAATAGGEIASVRVVTGHAADAVERFLAERPGLDVGPVFNPDYARLNNWYSVLVGLRTVPEGIERVVIVNADLFAAPGWFAAFFNAAHATTSDALIAIDLDRELTDESMKVAVRDGSTEGRVVDAIGKVGITRGVGEYVGLLMAGGDVLREFRGALESFEGDAQHADAWYERAVGITAAAGTEWRVWPTPSTHWVEIDDHADHEAALGLSLEAYP